VTRPRVLRQLRLARLVGRVRARAPPRGPRPVRSGRVVPFDAIRVGRFGLVRARPRLAASRVGWFGLVRRVAVCCEPCRAVRSGQACRRLRRDPCRRSGLVRASAVAFAAIRVDGPVRSGRVPSPSLRSVSTVGLVRACVVAFAAIRVDGPGAGQRRLGRSPATASMRSGSGRCRVLGVRVPLACDASARSSSPTQASRRMARRSPFPVGTSRPTGPHARDSPTRVAPAGSGACARRRERARRLAFGPRDARLCRRSRSPEQTRDPGPSAPAARPGDSL
jgi:hypothetical protein